jgi:hypothetical protein
MRGRIAYRLLKRKSPILCRNGNDLTFGAALGNRPSAGGFVSLPEKLTFPGIENFAPLRIGTFVEYRDAHSIDLLAASAT